MIGALDRLLDRTGHAFLTIANGLLLGMLAINVVNILSRLLRANKAFVWVFPWTGVLFTWAVFLGIYVVYRRGQDVTLDIVTRRFPTSVARVVEIGVTAIVVILIGTLLWQAPTLLPRQVGRIDFVGIQRYWLSIPLFVSLALVALHFLLRIVKLVRADPAVAVGCNPPQDEGTLRDMIAVALFGAFLVLVLLRMPIAMAIGVAIVMALVVAGFADTLWVVPMKVLESGSSVSLLAIPFFILAGNLMNAIGISERIFNLADALVGHFRAGLAQVNVVASVLLAGGTGAAVADIAGLGRGGDPRDARTRLRPPRSPPRSPWCRPSWRRSSPPSVPLVIYAFLSNTSVERMFLAGIVPGFLVAGSLMLFNRFLSTRRDFPRQEKADPRETGPPRALRSAGADRARHHHGRHPERHHHRVGGGRARLGLHPGAGRGVPDADMEGAHPGADRDRPADLPDHADHRLRGQHGLAAGHRAGAAEPRAFPCPSS